MATLRLGLRVVIGTQQRRNMPRLQRLAHHATRVLAKPVQLGLLAQLWRRTGPGSWPRQHFLHYFSVETPEASGRSNF